MAAVTASMVKELRERTGLGMMDCKRALQEADGSIDAAIDLLRKSSALKAAKKAGRIAAEGLLAIEIAGDRSVGAVVEINIETDFAARNDSFVAFVGRMAQHVLDTGSDDPAAYVTAEIEAEREKLVQEIGENITIRRAAILRAADGGAVHAYQHTDNRKAALVAVTGGTEELARDVAMHVTAQSPMVLSPENVPEETVARERGIYEAQAAESGKPPEIVTKMVEGRVRKYLAEVSLLEQPFVKDGDQKVGKLLSSAGAACSGFVRFEVGEGIEKEETDFAAEVEAQVKASQEAG